MAAAGGPMTRSRIEAFDQTAQALADLADRLRSATPVLQQAVDDYVDQMGAPNGTEWEGDTAASYFATATSDRLSSVAPAITHANELADISARGSDYLLGAREAALEAISQAEADEFTVGEDLSVSDNYAWESREQQAARQAAAVAHRNYIAHLAARLEAANASIAGQLNAGAAEMTALTPAHWREPFATSAQTAPRDPNTTPKREERQGKVLAVDRTFKRDGGADPKPPADDPAADAARRYGQTQRAADQAIVDKAKREGRTHYQTNDAGQPGNMTDEEAAAQQRLKDYAAITDPTGRFGPGYDQQQAAQTRRLAGERLDDYNKSKFVGPLPTDTVTGADARTRAQARLELQHALEQGQAAWHPQPMTTDEATRIIDQMEATDRASVLTRLQQQLQQAGMTPAGAAQVAQGIAHGTIPQEYVDAAAAAGKPFDAGKEGIDKFAESLPTGKHWAPGVAFSAQDIEVLKKLGRHIGYVGNALELGTGLYEVFGEDKSPLEVGAKAAGGFGGAYVGGEFLGTVGAAAGGPPGAFIGVLIGGTAGAFVGEAGVERAIEWLKE
ncbi:hypothetical protein PFI50_12900 [Mycobacterium xenopi]|nr:hypothetical protein [Mycobacterium xenopi]MDA3640303.1 hypothetical protein [Mycobacterium xenopi]